MKGRKTGGRKTGTPNKRTLENERKARESGLMPLDYALKVMRDPNVEPQRRDWACQTAIPYLHARRAPEDKKGNIVPPMVYTHPSLEADGSDVAEDKSELLH